MALVVAAALDVYELGSGGKGGWQDAGVVSGIFISGEVTAVLTAMPNRSRR